MSKQIFELEKDAYAIVDTSRGTVSFSKSKDSVIDNEIGEKQKEQIIDFYLKQFKKNKKIAINIKDRLSRELYEDLSISLRNELNKRIDLDEIRFVDVHLSESSDLSFFEYIWENKLLGHNCRDGCIYVDPCQQNISSIIDKMRKMSFLNICFVVDVRNCLQEKKFDRYMTVVDEATRHGLIVILLLNVSDDSVSGVKEVYYKLFKEGALRTKINEIWVNCVYKKNNYISNPLELMIINNIRCYEKIMSLFSDNHELMAMRIVGNNYVKRIQSVFEERVPLRPIQAYEIKELVLVEIESGRYACKLYSKEISKCQKCDKLELCGGLFDNDGRCIDFKNVMNSVFKMYKFIKGE